MMVLLFINNILIKQLNDLSLYNKLFWNLNISMTNNEPIRIIIIGPNYSDKDTLLQ